MQKLYSIEIVYPESKEAVFFAERLKRELETYRAPASVRKKTGKNSLADVTEPWFIVLCTPETPASEEVQERIRAFSAEGLYHHILTLLVSGERSESFPEELLREQRADGTVITHSPLAGNIRSRTMRQSLRLLSVEKLRLLAPFYGVSFDELRNRRRRARTRICFADAPEKDYDLPFTEDTASKGLKAEAVLCDGSFIGREYPLGKKSFRYDPFKKEFLPFYDGEENEENDPGPLFPDGRMDRYEEIEGADGLIFGYTSGSYGFVAGDDAVKTHVYSKEPFRYLYTMDHVLRLFRPPGSAFILGLTGNGVLVFSTDPFRYLYTMEDEYLTSIETYDYEGLRLPDGRELLYTRMHYTKAVYDLDAGKRLSVIAGDDQGYDMEISSDGLILSRILSHPALWRPEDGSLVAEIPVKTDVSPDLFGDHDEASGRRGAEAIRVNSFVYIWKEEASLVPEDLEGRVSLARFFRIKNRYHLRRK